jgi:hypothetical protein
MKYIIKESQYVYLLENLEKNKKFLTNVMGVDFTGKIEKVKSLYDVPYNFYRKGFFTMSDVASYLKRFGPMYVIELDDKKYIYQDRGRYESFIGEDGSIYEDKIPEKLGIDVMGLRFSDIIDMYSNDGEPLNENTDKNKKFLTNHMDYDFTDKIQMVTSSYDVPMSFDEGISPELIGRFLNYWGPMYLVNIKGKKYLYQDRGDFEWFLGEDGYDYVDNEITDKLNIDELGLRFSDIIDMYFNEGKDQPTS